MARNKDQMIPVLFRYFMAAELMHKDTVRYVGDPQLRQEGSDPMLFLASKIGLSSCLWYGMLFVVIDGWQKAELKDPEIDPLLTSPNVYLLKQFRNAMFHFQKEWLSPKVSEFCRSPDGVEWVFALHIKFRRYFDTEMARIGGGSCGSIG